MIPLSRTEVIFFQDELKVIAKQTRNRAIHRSCQIMITTLEAAVKRREDQVATELKTPEKR